MSKFKQCPKCNKQLPVTASNCKYCGASLGEKELPSIFDNYRDMLKSKPPGPPSQAGGGAIKSAPPPPPPISTTGSRTPPPPPPSVIPAAAASSNMSSDDDDWIPDADEPSEMIDLDNIGTSSDKVSNTAHGNAAQQSSVPGSPQAESNLFSNSPPKGAVTDEKTAVLQMPEQYLENMNAVGAKDPSALSDDLLFGSGALENEASELIDLDNIEDPDEPSSEIASVFDDEPSAMISPILDSESSAELSGLMDLDDDDDFELPSEESEIGPLPTSNRSINPSQVGKIPAVGSNVVPPKPLATAPQTSSITPPAVRSSTPATALSPAATAANPSATMATIPPSAGAMTSVSSPPVVSTSPMPFDAQREYQSTESTAIIDADELYRRNNVNGFAAIFENADGEYSTKKIIVLSSVAFAVTLALAVAIWMIFLGDSEKQVEVVDSSTLEPKTEIVASAPTTTSSSTSRTKTDDAQTSNRTVDSAVETAPKSYLASNCLPLARYGKKFPWKGLLDKLLQKQGVNKVCQLLGTPSSVVADVFSSATMIGPTGYDWIIDGGRIEVFPGNTAGARMPSIEFIYTKGKLFKIKLKYRNAKVAKRLNVDNLQEFFKKETTQTDHLDRSATSFDEQDMKVVYIEEEWYGQTLKTLEFSSVKFNEEMAGHIQKLERLESVYKAAEAAYFGWKFDEALEKYQEVSSMAPGIGAALVKQGLIYLRDDDFGQARSFAQKALENSQQDDVKAGAKEILAVNALRDGDIDGAKALLQEAISLSPSSPRFKSYLQQLDEREYVIKNIAQTAARMSCIEEGKSKSSELGVLARGFFPDKRTFQKSVKTVSRKKEFKDTKKSLIAWECK